MIQNDPRFQHLFRGIRRDAAAKPSWVQKVGAVIVGVVFFAVVLMFSVVLFAVALTAGAAAWAYFWWKTRAVRKAMRDHPPGGMVIEGEVIREVDGNETRSPRAGRQPTDQRQTRPAHGVSACSQARHQWH